MLLRLNIFIIVLKIIFEMKNFYKIENSMNYKFYIEL